MTPRASSILGTVSKGTVYLLIPVNRVKRKSVKMPRKPRTFKDDGFYHVISRGNNQKPVFLKDVYFEMFKQLLLESKKKYDFKLFHYCLMPNHVHLLVRVAQGRSLPKIMHFLLLSYSRWFKKKTNYTGYLWQGRYKSPLIEQESYMLECGRYIERNPMRARLSKTLEGYTWSSYRYYALGELDPLIDADPYFESFGRTCEERQMRYKEFVRIEMPYESLLDKALAKNYV